MWFTLLQKGDPLKLFGMEKLEYMRVHFIIWSHMGNTLYVHIYMTLCIVLLNHQCTYVYILGK